MMFGNVLLPTAVCFGPVALAMVWVEASRVVSYRKVGGLRFLKLGRLTLSWSVSRDGFRPIGGVRS